MDAVFWGSSYIVLLKKFAATGGIPANRQQFPDVMDFMSHDVS
nr:hypothetical protein [Bacillus atrophaeus]